MSLKNQDLNYKAVLGLKKDPFSPEPDPSFYFAFESIEHRMSVFKNLVEGTDILVLVSGEPGSGKTSLLNRYFASSEKMWKPCRLRADPAAVSVRTPEPEGYPAYIQQDSKAPILIVDDAHKLSPREFKFLLRETLVPGRKQKIKRLVLLGETNLFNMVTNLAKSFSDEITVNQVFLPGLTEEETATYLQHRMVVAGYAGEKIFRPSAVKKIHHTTGGFPGPLNRNAAQWLKDNYSHQKKRRGIHRRLVARPMLALSWIAGIACLLLAAFVFYTHRNPPISLLSDLKIGPNVFHSKIPEERKNTNNLFRQKIPVEDKPVKQIVKKIENVPLVEKKAVPSQPNFTPPEQREPKQETDLRQPLESPIKDEIIPQLAKAAPSQPIVALPEQREQNQGTGLDQPLESPVKDETTPQLAKAVPSQSTVAPPERSQPRQETELHPSPELQSKIETILPAKEQSVSSQATSVPSEGRELPEKAGLHQAEERPQPVKENVIEKEKPEERMVHNETWLLSQGSSRYTIQIMGTRNEALLYDFVKRNQLLEQNEIAFYQTTFQDKPWFQLLYGVYATKKDAQSAADSLPQKIRKSSPWIRRLSAVQKVIRNKAPH